MATNPRVLGLRKVKRNLRAANDILVEAGEEGLIAAAEVIMTRAVEIAPVKTGRLVRSAFVSVAPKRKTVGARVNMGFRVHYAGIVEARLGFMARALEEKAPDAIDVIRNNATRRLLRGIRSKT